jgi:hypothetical protein
MIHVGDCRSIMPTLPAESVDAIVTDPPYELGFMGKGWDKTGVAFDVRTWTEALRIAKPGAYLVAFGGTRTFHRMMVAIEEAGWDVRDTLMWVYGSGFPKSRNVSFDMDRMASIGSTRDRALRFTEWMRTTGLTSGQLNAATGTNMGSHYLTALEQPAIPTVALFDRIRPLLREPVPEYVEAIVRSRDAELENLQRREVVGQHEKRAPGAEWRERYSGGTAADATAITAAHTDDARRWEGWGTALKPAWEPIVLARKPFLGGVAANVLKHGTGAVNIDGCRVEAGDGFPERWPANVLHDGTAEALDPFPADASRFFYCAKASPEDRHDGVDQNTHATVKPTALMRWLCRLVTPPGGLVFDPFTGSGSTGRGAIAEGFRFAGCELDPANAAIAEARTRVVQPGLGF